MLPVLFDIVLEELQYIYNKSNRYEYKLTLRLHSLKVKKYLSRSFLPELY